MTIKCDAYLALHNFDQKGSGMPVALTSLFKNVRSCFWISLLKDSDTLADRKVLMQLKRNHVAAVSFWPGVQLRYCGQHKELL